MRNKIQALSKPFRMSIYRNSFLNCRALVFALGVLLCACGEDQTLVQQLALEKKYFSAQKLLEKIYINPNIADAEDFKLAVAQFREVVDGASALPATEILDGIMRGCLMRIAQLELMRDNVDGTIAAYEEIVRRYPNNEEITIPARLTLGILHERALQYGDAINAYSVVLPSLSSRIAAQEPEMYLVAIPFHFARMHKHSAQAAQREQAYRQARECYQTMVAKFPNSKVGAAAVSYLAALLADQNEWQALDGLLNQEIARHAQSSELPHFIYTRALALHERLGQTAAAWKMLADLVAKHPEHEIAPQARFEMARMLFAQNQNEAARQTLKQVIAASKTNPNLAARAHEEIAMSYEREGQWNFALNEYRWLAKQYEIFPSALKSHLRIAEYYMQRNEAALAAKAFSEAVAFYQGLITKYPRSMLAALAQEHIANCFMAQQRWDEAAAAAAGVENILDNTVGKVSTSLLLGNIYESSGQTQRAVKVYNEFMQQYPQHPLLDVLKERVRRLTGL